MSGIIAIRMVQDNACKNLLGIEVPGPCLQEFAWLARILKMMPSAEDGLVIFVKASLRAGPPGTVFVKTNKQGLKANPARYGGLASAKNKLNEMTHETSIKLDLELIRCATHERSQLGYIEKLKQDISTFNAAAAAASEMLHEHEQEETSIYQEKFPQTKVDLRKLLQECAEAKLDVERQLRIVIADIQVMERVMAMTDCNSTMMLMLQCVDPSTGKIFWKYDENPIQQMLRGFLLRGLCTAHPRLICAQELVSLRKRV